jgi:hypothetical protein
LALQPGAPISRRFHAVRFYDTPESLASIVAQFLGEGFVTNAPAVVIATPEHRHAIKDALHTRGFDVARLEARRDLLMLDAADLLATFMVNGMPDGARFHAALAPLLDAASANSPDAVIRAYGEMVDVLWKDGQTAAATRLETLWNELPQERAFALLCGYRMGSFYKDTARGEVCRHHTHVVLDDGEATVIQ